MSRLDPKPKELDDLNPINGAIFNFSLSDISTFYPNLKFEKNSGIFFRDPEYKVEQKMTLCITHITGENVS